MKTTSVVVKTIGLYMVLFGRENFYVLLFGAIFMLVAWYMLDFSYFLRDKERMSK